METFEAWLLLLALCAYLGGIVYTAVTLPTTSEKIIITACVAFVFPIAILAGLIGLLELLLRLVGTRKRASR